MKWTTAASLVVALGFLGFVTKAIFVPDHVPAREVVANVRASLSDPGLDFGRTLRVLDRALGGPEAEADEALAIEILTLRSEVFELIGSYTDARTDLERIQGMYGVADAALELSAARLQAREGQLEEAWQRVGRLLAREPELGAAWLLRGRLERDRARQHVERAVADCGVALVSRSALVAAGIARQIAARDIEDPTRSRLAADLREIFLPRHESDLQRVLEEVDEASRLNGAARHSYGQAIESGVDAEAVKAFLDLLVQGGQADLAVEFGLAAIALDELSDDGSVHESLLDAMRGLGQDGRALALLDGWPWRERVTELTFNRKAARLFYDLAAWKEVAGPTAQMKELGGPQDRSYAHFYQGLVHHQRALQLEDAEKHEKAISTLTDFLAGQAPQPVPDAAGIAYLAMARSHRELQQERLERQSLMGAIEVAPRLSGEAYLRLVELQRNSPNVGFRIPEVNWTRGMALLPQRTAELYSTWETLGVASLAADDVDFKSLVTRVRQLGEAAPTRSVGPFTLHRLSREHFAAGNLLGALAVARDLYDEYPGLLPALDTLIDTLLARGSRLQAAVRILERLRLVGADEASRAYLAQVRLDSFDAAQRLELVRRDALGLGRRLVAEHHLERGDPELALRALRVVEDDEAPELELLRALALLELERGDEAAEAAARALTVERLRPAALEALVRARLLGDDEPALARVVEGVLAEETLDRELVLRLADRLIAGSRPALASSLLDRLDAHRETRGGDVLVRMALAHALAGDGAAAAEALERAEAFIGDGRVELTRLYLTLDGRDWLQLPRRVAALRAGGFSPGPLQSAILALLDENLDAGLAEARAGLEAEPQSGAWALVLAAAQLLADDELELPSYFGADAVYQARQFLRGDGETQRDPREGLGLLLALEQPGWGLWVLPRLVRAYSEGGGSLWPQYLAARAEAALGQHAHALSSAERLTQAFPGFGPAWDTLEQERRRGHADDPHHPDLLLVREGRLRALGDQHAGTPAQLAMDRATARAAGGEVSEAIADLERFVERAAPRDREQSEVRAFLAHLLAERGNYSSAAAHYLDAIQSQPPRAAAVLVPALLGTLTRATRAGVPPRARLEPDQVAAILAALAERLPTDPHVALAVVRHELSRDARNLSLAVNRATGAYEALRQRTEGKTLDELRPGAGAAWAAFLRELSPQLAVQILTEELERAPANVTLWLQLARAQESLGDETVAVGLLQTAIDLSDDPRAHQEMARLVARRGGDPEVIERHLAFADAAEGRQDSYRTQFIRARTDLQRTGRRPVRIVERLQDLWEVREEFSDEVSSLELGLTYAAALLQRLEGNDARILHKLVRTMQPYAFGDPYALDMLDAYGGVTRALRARVDAAQAAEAAGAGEEAAGEEPRRRRERDAERPRRRERPADEGDGGDQ
jgi:hypothetical protein